MSITNGLVRKGPPRNYEMVDRVVRLRRKGLSYRQIARELHKDLKTVYVWASYASVGVYPQSAKKDA